MWCQGRKSRLMHLRRIVFVLKFFLLILFVKVKTNITWRYSKPICVIFPLKTFPQNFICLINFTSENSQSVTHLVVTFADGFVVDVGEILFFTRHCSLSTYQQKLLSVKLICITWCCLSFCQSYVIKVILCNYFRTFSIILRNDISLNDS